MDTFSEDLKGPPHKHTTVSKRAEMEGGNTLAAQRSLPATSSGLAFLKRNPAAAWAVENREYTTSNEDPWGKLSNDMVEFILARLPLFPLRVSRKVCKRWRAIVSTPEFGVLHKKLGEPQPWFVFYGMNYLVATKSQAFAFDDETNTWITLPRLHFPPHNFGSLAGGNGLVTAIAGPGENKLKYKLTNSPSSSSSFGDVWHETPPMGHPRYAPVVSVAHGSGRGGHGHKVVVAGGVPDFEPEHMAVEVFDSETGAWGKYESLPAEFSGSSSRLWMSGAVYEGKFYVSLIHSWSIYALDLTTKVWSSVQWERPPGLVYHHILAAGARLLVAGLCQQSDPSTEKIVKIWKIDSKTHHVIEIGTMPKHFLAALEKNVEGVPNLNFLINENVLYVYKANAQDRPVVVGVISLEESRTEWRALPSLPTTGYRFDNMIAICTSMSISS